LSHAEAKPPAAQYGITLERGEPLTVEEILRIPIFQGISESLLRRNQGAVVRRRFHPGELVCREGEYGSTAFYILDGVARVFTFADLERWMKPLPVFGAPPPGLAAAVRFETRQAVQTALARDVARHVGEIVAMVVADGRAQRRVVRAGWRDGPWVEIVTGLREGERILLDPGLGFGKTVTHNLLLLHHLDELLALGQPVVVGPSRKSFIGRVLDVEVDERVCGTLACVAMAACHHAHIVRVHDVTATVQFLTMWRAIADAAGREHRPRRHRAPSPARIAA